MARRLASCPGPAVEIPDAARARRFARDLLDWHAVHGRHDLPWQLDPTPYRVWISEIMLQQTQVSAAIPYYRRFLRRFPSLERLAAADVDDVMHQWSGLGYYARARNLHRAAGIVMREFGGKFPDNLDAIMSLPGIGRSTAGAILAFCHGQRHPILDGNVKRVLARCFAVPGYPGDAPVANVLWELSDRLTPEKGVAQYTQAIMDLGATVCTRSRPDCDACPLVTDCLAFEQGDPAAYPGRRAKPERPLREVQMLLIEDAAGNVLLEKRPPTGIWGGLWSLPEAPAGKRRPACPLPGVRMLAAGPDPEPLRHGFTHFELLIRPRRYRLTGPVDGVMDGDSHLWYNPLEPQPVGLPAAIRRLLSGVHG